MLHTKSGEGGAHLKEPGPSGALSEATSHSVFTGLSQGIGTAPPFAALTDT